MKVSEDPLRLGGKCIIGIGAGSDPMGKVRDSRLVTRRFSPSPVIKLGPRSLGPTPRLNTSADPRIYAPMSVHKLFAILVALAVLFAPAFSRGGEASAAMPDHHAQMMKSGHCDSPSSDADGHDKAAEKSCCVSMCMGVAIAPSPAARGTNSTRAPAVSSIPTLHLAQLAEIATPPPKSA